MDGLSEDHKIETQRDIQQRMTDELMDVGMEQSIHLNFYLTSIYDHSILEAFSKVIQKLMPRLAAYENLLNILCSNCAVEKAFLFDICSKIYIATDSSPVDMQSYELCSDMIDVVVDMSLIYNYPPRRELPQSQISTTPNNNNNNNNVNEVEESLPQLGQVISGHGKANSIIHLNNGLVMIMDHVTASFALVCLMRAENFTQKRGWVTVNFNKFKESLIAVLEL